MSLHTLNATWHHKPRVVKRGSMWKVIMFREISEYRTWEAAIKGALMHAFIHSVDRFRRYQ